MPSRVRSVAEALVAVGAGLGVVAALVGGSIYFGLRGTESFDTRVDPPAQPAAEQRSEIDAARTCDALDRLWPRYYDGASDDSNPSASEGLARITQRRVEMNCDR